MPERKQVRRQSQALFYDATADRRRLEFDRRGQPSVPAMPGSVRPGPGEAAPCRERRRVPESGTE